MGTVTLSETEESNKGKEDQNGNPNGALGEKGEDFAYGLVILRAQHEQVIGVGLEIQIAVNPCFLRLINHCHECFLPKGRKIPKYIVVLHIKELQMSLLNSFH